MYTASTQQGCPTPSMTSLNVVLSHGHFPSHVIPFHPMDILTCFTHIHSIDFKIKTIELDGKRIKLQIWDTAGQERFRTITTAYYRGAMGILLVYDVTDEQSFQNIRNWIRTLEQHAADNVDKILIGNKCDVDSSEKVIETERGVRLASEYKINFFETSAKSNINVNEAFYSIATDIKKRLVDNPAQNTQKPQNNVKIAGGTGLGKNAEGKSKCSGCGR